MPDLDIVNPISPGWYRPYKLVVGWAEPAEVGRAALKALAKSLRCGHGLESLSELVAVAGGVIDGSLPAADGVDRLHTIERASGGDRHTKVGVQAVIRIIAEGRDELTPAADLTNLVAARFCKELLAHHLFGSAWEEVLQERFQGAGEAESFTNAVASIVNPHIARLGEVLARNPEGASLRAPAIRNSSRHSTAELLEETIVL